MSVEALQHKFLYISSRALIASVILHIVLPLFIVLSQIVGIAEIKIFQKEETKKLEDRIYQDFIQVDVVALPDLTPEQMKSIDTSLPIVKKPNLSPPAKPTVKEKTVAPDIMTLQKEKLAKEQARKKKLEQQKKEKERKKKQAAERKKKAERKAAMEKMKREAEREAAIKALALNTVGNEKGRPNLPGNRLSEGNSTTGNIGSARDAYIARLTQAIRNHFNIYPWQKNKNLVNTVYLEVSETGRIKKRRIKKSSGNTRYDRAVLAAVDEAKQLPIPEDISIVADGIEVEFRP